MIWVSLIVSVSLVSAPSKVHFHFQHAIRGWRDSFNNYSRVQCNLGVSQFAILLSCVYICSASLAAVFTINPNVHPLTPFHVNAIGILGVQWCFVCTVTQSAAGWEESGGGGGGGETSLSLLFGRLPMSSLVNRERWREKQLPFASLNSLASLLMTVWGASEIFSKKSKKRRK